VSVPNPMKAKSVARQARIILEMIKIEHTVFALPFALLGAMLAAGGRPSWRTVGWIVVAMVGARSFAMAFNRLADRRIDAANPRTASRAIPAGLVSPAAVTVFTAVSAAVLVVAAWQLNRLALALSPVALAILALYSYTKRFTWASHLVLGLALGGAPLGAWIAVRGDVAPTPFVLAAAVLLWVGGFDILYALQDLDFDRRSGLYSIPARFGVRRALWLSATLHAAVLVLLALLPRIYSGSGAAAAGVAGASGGPLLGTGYWVGWVGCLALLAYQHWVVRPGDLSRLDGAFFQANGILSIWLFAASALDLLRP
jgi:4-hydroxybenzoate polyprenyltransferase